MDRFQQFLNDGWRPEQVPMRLRSRPIEITGSHEDRGESSIRQPPPMKRLSKIGTIPRAVGCACPACNITTKRMP